MIAMNRWLLSVGALVAALPLQAAVLGSDGWSRQTVPGVEVAVGYLTLRNTGTERRELIKVTAPQVDSVQVHRSSVDAQGVSRMWPVGKLELLPGEAVKLAPNGLHLMLVGLKQPLAKGAVVPVTLVFEHEKPITVPLQVRGLDEPDAGKPVAPKPTTHDHGAHAGH